MIQSRLHAKPAPNSSRQSNKTSTNASIFSLASFRLTVVPRGSRPETSRKQDAYILIANLSRLDAYK
jgi:hypothetical protein